MFMVYVSETQPLVDFLRSIKNGSTVLMASYDEPATKLSEEARNLIAEMGSTYVKSLGFRDNWVFVGAKALPVKLCLFQHIKNNDKTNVYENWPEIIDMDGCIPKHME
uniref:ILEI/PANDER domain-containing protein n=1 Tax=Mola mola TaxID=94237 RepID=A0A3Q3WZY3_MOLML